MTEHEGYRKLAKDLEYLYIAETRRKPRIWFHKHKKSSPQRVEDYNAGVMAERDRILESLNKDRCVDKSCNMCEATNFHIELIMEGQDD